MALDVIIIGGGPSGLAAALALVRGGYRVAVFEKGKHIYDRDKHNAFDIANGIGGAGLFSDGKFSFYPAATNLWRLDAKALQESYRMLDSLLKTVSINIPVFQNDWLLGKTITINGRKHYDSIQVGLSDRLRLVFRMCDEIGSENLFINQEIVSLEKHGQYYFVNALNLESPNKEIKSFSARTILISSGKHAFRFLESRSNGIRWNREFVKYEFGIRLDMPSSKFDYYQDEQKDIKLVKSLGDDTEVRTFCCCRDGEVIESSVDDLCGLNGESSPSKTGKTNIGIHLRVSSEKSRLASEVRELFKYPSPAQSVSLEEFLNPNIVFFTKHIDSILREFIQSSFPTLSNAADSSVYFPSYECDGYYPKIDNNLCLLNERIWFAGDSTGHFRGLTAAFVSGFHAGLSIAQYLKSVNNLVYSKLKIKTSRTERLSLAFTAQSKQYFYCRDAVCAYVMRHNYIPVNPFRVFGYFLDDRVSRDTVRNGNNELISRCDELWVFGPIADGVLFEIAISKKIGIPIRFFSISSYVDQIKEIGLDDIVFEPEVHAKQIKREDLLDFLKNVSDGPIQLQLFNEKDDQ